MDVEITKKNGETFRLSEYDIQAQDFNVSSIELLPSYGTIKGRSGTVDYGADYGSRTISVPFYLRAYDMLDYPLLRDELFSLVTTKESFYIRELRRPSEFTTCDDGYDDEYVGGKRYLVRLSNVIDLDQQRIYGFGEMVFEITELPYAESVGTSMDVHHGGLDSNAEIWAYGMGLLADEETQLYKFDAVVGQTFRMYNPSSIQELHPFECDLKITIKNVVGSIDKFQIINLSNGSRASVTKKLNSTDVLVYDGPNITINNLQALRDTRRDFVSLSPGWNNFQIYHCDIATVEFDFRFYYY